MPLDPIFVGSEFQVNTYTTLNQRQPDIAALSDGGYVVVWHSQDQDTSSRGIYAQRYDADGTAVGGELFVNTHIALDQQFPRVTGLDGGGFVVTWESYRQVGTGDDIYAQMYDANGVATGSEFKINTTTSGFQSTPDISSLADGGFVVVWEGQNLDGSGYGVIVQRFDAAGVAQGSEIVANTYTTVHQWHAKVTGLDGGGFVVTWESEEQDTDGNGVYGQVFDSTGAVVGGEIHVSTETTFDQDDVAITGLTGGGFVVTWESDFQDGSNTGVYAQMYDATGGVIGSEFLVNTFTTGSQYNPEITAMADGGFLITWQSFGTATPTDIYAQRYDASGAVIGDEFLVNTTITGGQAEPSITTLKNGGFVVTWGDSILDGDGYGIYAQQFAAQLFGTSGGDVLEDTVGAGWINGQNGGDELYGFGGQDTIYGGGGADTLSGGASKDFLFGQGGEDTLKGGKGNDELDGGIKDDKLTGGDGKDKFIFMAGSGIDKITDFEDDIDTFKLDEDIWGGGLTKQQVINTYASVDGGDILFDFGTDQLRLKGFTDLTELKDDMALI